MSTFLKRILVASIGLLVIIQLFRPSKTNPVIDPNREIGSSLEVNPTIAAIFERSCNDCHSSRTVWPWYSNWAPVSWLVARDVREGRRKLNLSEWAAYSEERKTKLLEEMCKEVTEGEMPGLPYLLLHPRAKLAPADVAALCRWAQVAKDGQIKSSGLQSNGGKALP